MNINRPNTQILDRNNLFRDEIKLSLLGAFLLSIFLFFTYLDYSQTYSTTVFNPDRVFFLNRLKNLTESWGGGTDS